MSDNVQVMIGERDGNRLTQLGRAHREVEDHDSGDLASLVLDECIQLWTEVLTAVSRYAAPRDLRARGDIAEAASAAAINQFDQGKVDEIIGRFREVDLNDQPAMHTVALDAVLTLEVQLSEASGPQKLRVLTEDGSTEEVRAYLTAWRNRSTVLKESLRALRLLDGLTERTRPVLESIAESRAETEEAGKQLDALRAELVQARAERAQGELSKQFKSLAEREHKSSRWLRWATYGLVAVAALAALMAPRASGWAEVVGRLALASIFAGASAYTARLASVHRNTGDWANSVRVQLDTFEDFLGAIDSDDARMRVYEEFGRRVLGAPPLASGDGENAMPVGQIVELASVIAAARKS
ncbi:hypothetical protein [Nocardioides conyzicola]|uniref:DUF4231 domain-containing protein n=1 Tax=Nocardioides conyzicola TaxID=1651781 RepID=A0ABP8XTU9_9ACTN